MSKRLPSPFPDMDGAGHSQHTINSGSGVPGFVFLSQPQGDSMRPSNRNYKPPSYHAANRGHHQFHPHPARYGNGNGYRGSDGNTSPYHNSIGRGRGSNANGGNNTSYGNMHLGNTNRGNNYFEGNSSPISRAAFANNSFHSPHATKSPNSHNSPRGHSSPFGFSSPGASNFQSGPNSSPVHPPSLGGSSPFGSPATPNSPFQSSPFSGSRGRGHRGRGGRGQNSSFSGNNRRGGRGGRNTPLSEVPAEKFMSAGILQNPWDRLINSLDPKSRDVFLAEDELDDAIGVDNHCSGIPIDPSIRPSKACDDTTRTSGSPVPSRRTEESNDQFADSWK